MNAWLPFAHAWLLDLGVLTTVLLAAAMFLRIVLHDAKSRVLLAWCTWLGIAAAALVTLLPGWPRYDFRAVVLPIIREKPVVVISVPESALPVAVDWSVPLESGALEPIDPPELSRPIAPWRDLTILSWLSAAITGLVWIALGAWQSRRLLHQSHAAPDWIHAELKQLTSPRMPRADVRTSANLSSAVALRARQPAILLPQSSADPSNAKTVRAALAHEWVHIRHGDLWLLALERLLLPLLALHPLFWWLRRSTRLDQELLADAAAAGDKPVEYAEALVAWAKQSAPPPAALAALAFWDRPSNLTRRVHMILHKPRPASTWFGRALSLAAFASLVALVGGLSLFTLRPLAADEEPAIASLEPSAAELEPASERTPAPGANLQAIELACTTFEITDPAANDLLNSGIKFSHLLIDDWQQTKGELQNHPQCNIVSYPRIRTLNKQLASLQIGIGGDGREPLRVLKIELTPELLAPVDRKQEVLLTVSFERSDIAPSPAAFETTLLAARNLQTKVAVPLGKAVVFVDPTNRDAENPRRVHVAIEPKLVAVNESNAENPRATQSLSKRVAELTQQTEQLRQQLTRQGQDSAQPQRDAAALRHTLLRLQREIAALLDQTAESEAAANPSAVPAEAAAAPNWQNTKRGKVAKPAETRKPPQWIPVNGDPESVLKQLKRRMEDLNIKGITVNAASKDGSLIVSGSDAQIGEIRKLLFELERTAAATTEQQLQQKLLELDLREAEIGLQAAKAEYEQMTEVRSKNPAALSNAELRHSQLKVELAQIQVERNKVRLEAARAANPPPTPARR